MTGVANDSSQRAAIRICVRGQVQGVGFRPFAYRLACECGLAGLVRNETIGVVIELEGNAKDLVRFQELLKARAPAAAAIDDLVVESCVPVGRTSFAIEPSKAHACLHVRVPRDLAVCPDCRVEVFNPCRRQGYPFTNCTQCGPRYSIIDALPYDRASTAMHRFEMCPKCEDEYQSPLDRRFHAQPNACSQCGPRVALWDRNGEGIAGPESAIAAAAEFLRRGQVVAVKGLGGFQLMVPADDERTVRRLRERKNRPSKPFAVMVSSLEEANALAELDAAERSLLASPQNPIVLARKRNLASFAQVSPHVDTVGLLLPTTPLHHLLLAKLGRPVVATSGNRSDEPIVTDEQSAVRELAGIADAFLVHDRPIVRRVDDSVVRVVAGQPVTLRLARGYAPLPLPALEDEESTRGCLPILAVGGHQKVALAIWTGTQALLTQHLGDLDHPDTRAALTETADDLNRLYCFEPSAIACDLHPDYFSTSWASTRHKPVIQVQHHHAHAVACMTEHGLLEREVLAFTWDGTGYGTDGTIWGGEVLRARRTSFERVASLLPFPLPGGEAAIRHPGRIAFGMLYVLLGEETLVADVGLQKQLGLVASDTRLLASMIRRGINTPWTSSMGRLFDAVAALVLGIYEVSFEGEATAWLESVADPTVSDSYPLPLHSAAQSQPGAGDKSVPRGDWRPMLAAIQCDLRRDINPATISARFHNTLAKWADDVAAQMLQHDVVLSGGCFQNRLLAERTLETLQARGVRVYLHSCVPPGDGGLAAGQLAVALATNDH